MKIKQALFTAGYSSFYFDDQQAIKDGAGHDGFIYTGTPVTPDLLLFAVRVNAFRFS